MKPSNKGAKARGGDHPLPDVGRPDPGASADPLEESWPAAKGFGAGDPLEGVRRSLDELATSALTAVYRAPVSFDGEPGREPATQGPDAAAMLASLSQIAEQAGASGVVQAAGLVRSLREKPPGTHEELLEAIASLERAIEDAGSPGDYFAAAPPEGREAAPYGGREQALTHDGEPALAADQGSELPGGPDSIPLDSDIATDSDIVMDADLALDSTIAEAPSSEIHPVTPAAAAVAISADPELLSDFILESRDHLAAIEANLLTIEQEPGNMEAIHAVFRGFHTIKGLAGFLELPAMQEAAHEIETLLDHARNGKLTLGSALIDAILAGSDYIRTDVDRVEGMMGGAPPSAAAPNARVIADVRRSMNTALSNGASPDAAPERGPAPERLVPEPHAARQSEPAFANAPGQGPPVPAPSPGDAPGPTAVSGVPSTVAGAPAPPATESTRATDHAAADSGRLVKVATAKLDFLVDMIGELVIAQSMIHHDSVLSAVKSATLQRNLAQLGRITADVQKTAMSMRMVPVGQLFQKSVRMIRDLTRRSGKLAELEMSGEETQLDRTIVEELADPLLHMIRNSADHGIESPAERIAAGKPATARIGLKAQHRAGHIAIEISDDGRGLPREKILAKARQKGLVPPGAELSDKEVFNLIFEPGFSTAEKITDQSGRGVGMDVVRKQVQQLRGRIEIESRAGQGTTFILKLPLTLAIIDGLVVGVGEERYILPIYAVEEMFRPTAEAIFTVENRREMVLIRGGLLPVVRLDRRFSLASQARSLTEGVLVVAESGEKRFCLAVDQLLGKQEVVIKNLGEMFRHVPGVAGGAILGDGRVGLILDMDGIFQDAQSQGTQMPGAHFPGIHTQGLRAQEIHG